MRKIISILAILILCVSLAVTAFATDADFIGSVGEEGTPCEHENTSVVDQKDPTCTTDGYTGDIVCDDCGEVIEEGTIIPATGHQMKDGACIVCGTLDVPMTGDNRHVFLWISVMVVAAVVLVMAAGTFRKKA